jgi:hypothetical protein
MTIEVMQPAALIARDYCVEDVEPTRCAASDSSSSTCSGESLSDDDDEEQPLPTQTHHPLTSSSRSGKPLLLNASGKTFLKLHERSDSGLIRSRLFLKLGIELGNMTVGNASNGTPLPMTAASRTVQKGNDDAFYVALKRDHSQIDRNITRTKKPIVSLSTLPGQDVILEKSMKRERAVCFDVNVKVYPIPARSDYSNRMRAVMWVSGTEIQQNAARNTLEFAAEEWDVAKVVNDEDMIVYGGERIHPIHFRSRQ